MLRFCVWWNYSLHSGKYFFLMFSPWILSVYPSTALLLVQSPTDSKPTSVILVQVWAGFHVHSNWWRSEGSPLVSSVSLHMGQNFNSILAQSAGLPEYKSNVPSKKKKTSCAASWPEAGTMLLVLLRGDGPFLQDTHPKRQLCLKWRGKKLRGCTAVHFVVCRLIALMHSH